MPDRDRAAAVARRAIALLDLTELSDDCRPEQIDDLCARALTPHGRVAAVCVPSRYVGQAKRILEGTGVRIATVVNFPEGGEDTGAVIAEAERAVADGADEVDHVMARRAFLDGRPGFAETQILRLKEAIAGRALLKVILETGEIPDPADARRAAELALSAGADFLKTSTGRRPVSATPQSVRMLLEVIAASGRRDVGCKPAGGIRTVEDAAGHLALADEIMGPDWATPATFRFGASGLLTNLLAALEGRDAAAGTGY